MNLKLDFLKTYDFFKDLLPDQLK